MYTTLKVWLPAVKPVVNVTVTAPEARLATGWATPSTEMTTCPVGTPVPLTGVTVTVIGTLTTFAVLPTLMDVLLAASAGATPDASTTTGELAALLAIVITLEIAPCIPGPGFMVTVTAQLALEANRLAQPVAEK